MFLNATGIKSVSLTYSMYTMSEYSLADLNGSLYTCNLLHHAMHMHSSTTHSNVGLLRKCFARIQFHSVQSQLISAPVEMTSATQRWTHVAAIELKAAWNLPTKYCTTSRFRGLNPVVCKLPRFELNVSFARTFSGSFESFFGLTMANAVSEQNTDSSGSFNWFNLRTRIVAYTYIAVHA